MTDSEAHAASDDVGGSFEPNEHPTRPRRAGKTSTSRWRAVAAAALARGFGRESEGEFDEGAFSPDAEPAPAEVPLADAIERGAGSPSIPCEVDHDAFARAHQPEGPAPEPSVVVASAAAGPVDGASEASGVTPMAHEAPLFGPGRGPRGTLRIAHRLPARGPTGTLLMAARARVVPAVAPRRLLAPRGKGRLVLAAMAAAAACSLLALVRRPDAAPKVQSQAAIAAESRPVALEAPAAPSVTAAPAATEATPSTGPAVTATRRPGARGPARPTGRATVF